MLPQFSTEILILLSKLSTPLSVTDNQIKQCILQCGKIECCVQKAVLTEKENV